MLLQNQIAIELAAYIHNEVALCQNDSCRFRFENCMQASSIPKAWICRVKLPSILFVFDGTVAI